MMRPVLAAGVASLLLTTACRGERPSPSPAPVASRTVVPTVAAPREEPVAPVQPGVDAGTAFDALALEHPHRDGVDHLRRSGTMRDEGDLSGALSEARRAVADDPQDTFALLQVARLAGVMEELDLAAEAWGRIAQLDQEDAAAALQHARALIALRQFGPATMSALDAIERNPTSAEAQHVTGRAYLSAGDLASAITHFEKAVELAPDHGHALNNLGFAYLRANRNGDAVTVLEKAADLLPTVAYVQNNLGVALERTGRTAEAQGAYGLASSLSPKYIKAQLNQARVRKVASAAGVAEESALPPSFVE